MSSKGAIGKVKKLKNAKSFAVDGGSSVRMSVDDYMVHGKKPISRSSNREMSGKISEEANLVESIAGHELEVSKSAVVRKRRS